MHCVGPCQSSSCVSGSGAGQRSCSTPREYAGEPAATISYTWHTDRCTAPLATYQQRPEGSARS
eukprot:COSAG02_NODE_1230_length_13767_cov_16.238294_12_plen_64_part_00